MEVDTNGMMNAANAAFRQASELAVTYSFSIIGAIILIIAGFIVAGALERWTYKGLGHYRGFDETLQRFFSKLVRYAILVLVGVTVLAQFGVQTASIIAALGGIALAVGLALQGTLQNIAAGIMLLVLKPFRVGEYIDAGSVSGTIEEIGLFATEIKRIDGLYVLAPNSELWNTPVTNYSRNPQRRNDVIIGISYKDDIDLAQKALMGLAEADERVLKDPAPATFVSDLGDNWVSIDLRYWTTTADWWQTSLDMRKAGKKAFDENGITMPFTQREVRIVHGDADQKAATQPKRSTAKARR